MITLTANITIGTLAFSHAASVTCESGWQRMGDKCTVSFPRNIEVQGKRIGEILKAGQPASVALGYDGKNAVVLAGKVSRVSPEMPVVVEIEDGYYDLRRSSISKAYKQISLKELLADILPGTETVVPEIALGKLRFFPNHRRSGIAGAAEDVWHLQLLQRWQTAQRFCLREGARFSTQIQFSKEHCQ